MFQIRPSICGVNFPNNISIPRIRVNMSETGHDMTFVYIPPWVGKMLTLTVFSLLENIFVKLFVHLDIIQSLASHVEQFSNKCVEKSLTSFP